MFGGNPQNTNDKSQKMFLGNPIDNDRIVQIFEKMKQQQTP